MQLAYSIGPFLGISCVITKIIGPSVTEADVGTKISVTLVHVCTNRLPIIQTRKDILFSNHLKHERLILINTPVAYLFIF